MKPLILDVKSFELDPEEKEILQHPFVGGIILFSRNFHDVAQLDALVKSIRKQAPNLLISVDHEGGRVQRFRDGFSQIPAMASLSKVGQIGLDVKSTCQEMGWLMAAELLALNIDISFAPVLDLNRISDVIGSRSFSSEPDEVVELSQYFIYGMKQAGMRTTGKHFPGHGSVKADSHVSAAIDERSSDEIFELDMSVFKQLIQNHQLDAIMPAHVIYPSIDDKPAGFSNIWLQDILRNKLQFNGTIFSDDLSMEAASVAGGYTDKAQAALEAGCDMILACNNIKGAIEIIDANQSLSQFIQSENYLSSSNHPQISLAALQASARWKAATKIALQCSEIEIFN